VIRRSAAAVRAVDVEQMRQFALEFIAKAIVTSTVPVRYEVRPRRLGKGGGSAGASGGLWGA